MENTIKAIGSVILTILSFLFGGLTVPLKVLMFCIATDYITGVIKSYVMGDLDSRIGLKGILKKVGYLIIVALAYQIDKLTGNTEIIRMTVIYFFVVNEALSILENWGKIGLPIPPFLINKIEQLKNKED